MQPGQPVRIVRACGAEEIPRSSIRTRPRTNRAAQYSRHASARVGGDNAPCGQASTGSTSSPRAEIRSRSDRSAPLTRAGWLHIEHSSSEDNPVEDVLDLGGCTLPRESGALATGGPRRAQAPGQENCADCVRRRNVISGSTRIPVSPSRPHRERPPPGPQRRAAPAPASTNTIPKPSPQPRASNRLSMANTRPAA